MVSLRPKHGKPAAKAAGRPTAGTYTASHPAQNHGGQRTPHERDTLPVTDRLCTTDRHRARLPDMPVTALKRVAPPVGPLHVHRSIRTQVRGARQAARVGAPFLSYLPVRLWSMNTYLTLLTGGGLTAAGGVVIGLVNNWQGARRDKLGHKHDREIAREARSQERLEEAYLALGEYLSRFEDWARSVHPFLGPVSAPDPLQQ